MLENLIATLWLLLIPNPAAMRFEDGSLLPGFAFAKTSAKGVVLRKLFSLKVKFPTPAPARLTRPGNIVEFMIDGIVVATGRARKLCLDNMTFICRDVKEITPGAFNALLASSVVEVRVSGRPEGAVDVSQVDEIEHPINSPISAFIKRNEVTAIEVKYLKPRDRFEAFYQIWLAQKGTGNIALHGDFKGKRLFVYIATPEVWANVLGGEWGDVPWLYAQKNLCKVLKLMLTPTKATFEISGDARVYIGAKSGKDGPIFFSRPIKHDRLENGNCQSRTNPNICGLGCKGLGLSEPSEWLTECAYYGIDPKDYDVIINEDAIKINSRGWKPGDSVLIPWTAFRIINLNLRRGSGHIGRQIGVMPAGDAEEVLLELGIMDRVNQFIGLCKWNWREWLKVCSSMNDSKMEDNFFHAFLDLQQDGEDWVLPQDMTSLTRAKARLEIAWNDLLIKMPFGNRSFQIGYNFRVDAMEEEYSKLHNGEVRHFAVFPPECKKDIEEYGNLAVATFPMVNDKGILTVYPLRDEELNVIYGPKGMLMFSRAFLAKKWRDGDGDKCAGRGLKKLLQFPYSEIVDDAVEPKIVIGTLEECMAKILIQAQASWATSINVGVEDLTCSYVAMSLHRQGIDLTPEEQSDMGFRREAEGIHLLKHATGAGKNIETDPAVLMTELIARFGKGRVRQPSERQKLYFWVDRNDRKKSQYTSSKKALKAMADSFNVNNPGEIDHFIITKSANILTSPSVRIMHRLCNLLPAMFASVFSGAMTLDDRCKGNPYARPLFHLFVNHVWSDLNGKPKHADSIYAKKKAGWDWQVALHNASKGMISGKGYAWDLNTVATIAHKLDAFYTDATKSINDEFKRSKDWSTKGLRKHIQYGSLFRSIRFMLDGVAPGYEELYDCPSDIVFKYMGDLIGILPHFISSMDEEQQTHFMTLLSIAAGMEGWGLSAKKNRKSGGIVRLIPFEPCVLAEIEYWKMVWFSLTVIQKLDPMAAIAQINPLIRKYIAPEFDDGKFDILELGKGFDKRRRSQDKQISSGIKEEELAPMNPDEEDEDGEIGDPTEEEVE